MTVLLSFLKNEVTVLDRMHRICMWKQGNGQKIEHTPFFPVTKKEKQFFESVLKLQLHWSYTQVKLY